MIDFSSEKLSKISVEKICLTEAEFEKIVKGKYGPDGSKCFGDTSLG